MKNDGGNIIFFQFCQYLLYLSIPIISLYIYIYKGIVGILPEHAKPLFSALYIHNH